MAARTQYFKLFVSIFIAISNNVVSAQGLASEDRAIAEMATSIRAQASSMEVPQNRHYDEYRGVAQELANAAARMSSEQMGQIPDKPDASVIIFASHSLGVKGLEDLIQEASEDPDALVVFRGVMNENDVGAGILEIQKIAGKFENVANITITPRLFREYNVKTVPTIVYLSNDKKDVLIRAAGISRPEWLRRKLKDGDKGDLGVVGPVEKIAERDLTEVMKERAATIDWAHKKDEAIRRVWDKFPMSPLPRALVPTRRTVDPTVVVTEDIRGADGSVLVGKGTKANPLDTMPFTDHIFVFQPSDKAQVELVDERASEFVNQGKQVAYIATEFNRSKGWDDYKAISDHLDSHVFLLTPDIISRFELKNVPSVIYAEGNMIVVEELAHNE